MKMKKLLAAALAATMMFSSMVTSIVASAETPSTVVTIAPVAVGDEVYTADIVINFDPAVTGPHLLFDVDAEGATLTDIALKDDSLLNIYAEEGGENLADGRFIVEPKTPDKAVSAVGITATFKLTEAAAAGDEITVDVAVSDNCDWDENVLTIEAGSDTYTVEAPHECAPVTNFDATGHWTECECGITSEVEPHVFGDAAEAEDGKWYKSCECGYSEEVEAPVVEVTFDDVFPAKVSYDSKTFAAKYTFALTGKGESKVLNDFVVAEYGSRVQKIGMVMSIDGSIPTYESYYGKVLEYNVGTSSKFPAGTSSLTTGQQYFKMNIKQFSTDVKFVGFVTYIDGAGAEQFVYTSAISAKLIDYLTDTATEGTLESKLVQAYNDAQNGYSVSNTSYQMSTNDYSPVRLSYNLDSYEVAANFAFSAAAKNSVLCTEYVEENYGPIVEIGLLLDLQGGVATVDDNDGKLSYDISGSTKFQQTGSNLTTGSKYFNMNISQMGDTYSFTIYAGYTNAEGETSYIALDTMTINLMSILRTIEGNDAVTNIVEIYDMLNS